MTVYLALYKGRTKGRKLRDLPARLQDSLVRLLTRSPYSHCELAVPLLPRLAAVGTGFVPADEAPRFCCYSSSPRDGGVRVKVMELPSDKWDLLPLESDGAAHQKIRAHYLHTHGAAYDWRGVIGTVLPCIGHSRRRWFCSEWCAAALGLRTPHRHTPQSLYGRLAAAPYGKKEA